MSRTLVLVSAALATAVVVACVVVVGVIGHQRIVEEKARADVAEGNLSATRSELTQTQSTLALTHHQLVRTSRSLHRVSRQRRTLARQSHACRHLVQVNDHLLYGSVAYQNATGELLRKHPDMRAVKRSINRAHHHAVAILALVKHAGYRNISELVYACVPSRR